MVFIYVLKLTDGKYYVGKTREPRARLNTHFNYCGSAWTKKYKPIKLLKLFANCDDYDENKYTIKYMKKYGIDNVRGGSFCQFHLSEADQNTAEKMIAGSTDKCYTCGKKGHYASNCKEEETDLSSVKTRPKKTKETRCFRCNRTGHHSSDCYANTYANGDLISSDEESEDDSDEESESEEEPDVWSCDFCGKDFDTFKGLMVHKNVHCKNRRYHIKEAIKKDRLNKKSAFCYRCERTGHYASDCYAVRHIKGYYLS